MSYHEQEVGQNVVRFAKPNITELNTRIIELDGRQIKVKSRVPIRSFALEISRPGEVVEVLVISRVGLELYDADFQGEVIYTDGKCEGKIPAAFTPFYRPYKSTSDQLLLSGGTTYIAWHTDNPSDEKHFPQNSQGLPFQNHLVTTKSIAEMRKQLGAKGKKLVRLVSSSYSNELRSSQRIRAL